MRQPENVSGCLIFYKLVQIVVLYPLPYRDRKMMINKQIDMPSPFHDRRYWDTGMASVQWVNAAREVVCITTPNYTFYWRGRVDYTNFSEDYQYHGERLLPPKDDVLPTLKLHREPLHKPAQDIQQGDVLQSAGGMLAQVALAQPVRVYQEISTRSLRCGNHNHWQRWAFAHLFCLRFNSFHQ